jgi:hypothetical protein
MARTVMQFTFIEFDDNWTWPASNLFSAPVDAKVIVVAEGAAAVKETYWFEVPKGENVLVSWDANIVHIPARCQRKERGDQTTCGKD